MSDLPSNGCMQVKPLKTTEYNVPIRFNDICVFDGAFTFMKERFSEEMRRMEEEINLFSHSLRLYHAGVTSDRETVAWENLTNSPLVEGEGNLKTLKLQFDVSQFEPHEIAVKITNNVLVVSAQHEEKSDGSTMYNQYQRNFTLPPSIDPETVESILSKDGVLTVKAPLDLKELSIKDDESTSSSIIY